jgi:hypothetical protein
LTPHGGKGRTLYNIRVTLAPFLRIIYKLLQIFDSKLPKIDLD